MQKPRKKNCRPHWGSCLTSWTCGLQLCVFFVFLFSRFWPSGLCGHVVCSFAFFLIFDVFAWSAPDGQNLENPKKNKKTKLQTPLGLLSDFVDMWSAVFFWIFEVLAIWSRPCKSLENQKKHKKTKLQTPLGLLSDSVDMWSAVLFFFVFFGFSSFWPSGGDHAKTSIIKKQKKQNKTADPIGALV